MSELLLLEQLRTGFKRTIKWNKYRSEMTKQTKNNNLNYLIDPTFTKVAIHYSQYLLKSYHRIMYQMFK